MQSLIPSVWVRRSQQATPPPPQRVPMLLVYPLRRKAKDHLLTEPVMRVI